MSSKSNTGSSSTAVTPSACRYGIFSIKAGEGARCPTPRARRARESTHVHLVDDRFVNGLPERRIAFPIVRGQIHDGAPHRRRHVVAGTDRVGAPPERFRDTTGVRADEHLVRVEPVARRRLKRAVDTECIEVAGAAPSNEHVPEMKRLVLKGIEANGLNRFDGERSVEQQQHDLRRRLREEREVHPLRVHRHTRRMRGSRLDREDSHVGPALPFAQSMGIVCQYEGGRATAPCLRVGSADQAVLRADWIDSGS